MTATGPYLDRLAHAGARLSAEYRSRGRRLVRLARHRYGLPVRECEEIADVVLIAWHRELCATGELGSDDVFCDTLLCFAALDRLRRHQRAPQRDRTPGAA